MTWAAVRASIFFTHTTLRRMTRLTCSPPLTMETASPAPYAAAMSTACSFIPRRAMAGASSCSRTSPDSEMLRPRIIPCLLVHKGGLYKTVGFGQPKYVGDPLNAVRIFNEKEVDELMVVDIDATVMGREPNYALLKSLAAECRMPFCYAGGVTRVEQFERLVSLGIEKVGISAAAVGTPSLVHEASEKVGSQSVVVIIDVRKTGKGYAVWTHNGTRATKRHPVEFAREMQAAGAG